MPTDHHKGQPGGPDFPPRNAADCLALAVSQIVGAVTLIEAAAGFLDEGDLSSHLSSLKPPFNPNLHTPGGKSKLDTDSELRAFVNARMASMTFAEITAAVAANFPPERRVAMSSIHRYWSRNRRFNQT
ncbi:MAG: hypothetical protein ABI459_09035 [Deltaproteobacteria bacterium]